ncbi:right-handed parallel beta-helix repeat-containing protein [Brucepastera parasyntrophica]|uniref:right-handed parallel beta-helix repeat-containing protein n=1 Tax=Brucepastera parasyntrophica TaxID=2880008 RepID=UPI00210EA91F|nr:right-handed parallel beta-helix repeat-containing protein [Brucepastera parasyntrophica]ULQ59480.1 right-handed parallel beta-helix repeat-containing protein [Brucepastera parasyntrophica]
MMRRNTCVLLAAAVLAALYMTVSCSNAFLERVPSRGPAPAAEGMLDITASAALSAGRAAFPNIVISRYEFTVKDGAGKVIGSITETASGNAVSITYPASAGYTITVAGKDSSGKELVSGEAAVTEAHITAGTMEIKIYPVTTGGTGSVDLKIKFPKEFDDGSPVTRVIAELLRSDGTQAGQAQTILSGSFGEPDAGSSSITVAYDSAPAGILRLKLTFYRWKTTNPEDGIPAGVVYESLNVWANTCTDSWLKVTDTTTGVYELAEYLELTEDDFYDATVTLESVKQEFDDNGIVLDLVLNIDYYHEVSAEKVSLTFTIGFDGQSFTITDAKGSSAGLEPDKTSDGVFSVSNISLFPGPNKFVLTVTAPDKQTTKTYNLIYTTPPIWYVDETIGDDDNTGTATYPLASVSAALSRIAALYDPDTWPHDFVNNESVGQKTAEIRINGDLTPTADDANPNGFIVIDNAAGSYPPILLSGKGVSYPGALDADGEARVLYINNADVTLGENLTLKGGSAESGGGVYVTGPNAKFTVSGGEISENESTGSADANGGGGIYAGNGAKVFMTGGTVSENEAVNGGGLYVTGSGTALEMTNGTVTDNEAAKGGGVLVLNNAVFTMKDNIFQGGIITRNTAVYDGSSLLTGAGAGVLVYTGGSFNLEAGQITQNESELNGGGVLVMGGTFNMSGGTIGGSSTSDANKAVYGGGIVLYDDAVFTLTGGEISYNEAEEGGGVYINNAAGGVTAAMTDGKISYNTADSGGGVYITGTGHRFNMSGGEICYNEANASLYAGGGIYIEADANTAVNLSGSAQIHHNTATDGFGGGIYAYGGTIILSEAAEISENEALGGGGCGGGMYLQGQNKFTMNGGAVRGNTANSQGGGLFTQQTEFTMTAGSIEDNNAVNLSNSFGGGVYLDSGSQFTMSGTAVIRNNKANRQGGGVNIYCSTFNMNGGTITGNLLTNTSYSEPGAGVYVEAPQLNFPAIFSMSGPAQVTADNDVYLSLGGTGNYRAMLTVGGNLTASKAAVITPASYPSGTDTVQVLDGDTGLITANASKFGVTPQIDGIDTIYWQVDTEGKLDKIQSQSITNFDDLKNAINTTNIGGTAILLIVGTFEMEDTIAISDSKI